MREQLEQHILDDPWNDAPRLIYADWLDENGEPERAEFIRTQLALESRGLGNDQWKTLVRSEKKLLDHNLRDWLGGLAPYLLDNKGADGFGVERNCKLEFRRGFLSKVFVRVLTYDVAKAFCKFAETKWILELQIEDWGCDVVENMDLDPEDHNRLKQFEQELWGFYQLIESPFLTNIRWLSIGPYEQKTSDVWVQNVPELVAKMPRLEELHLFCVDYDLHQLFALDTLSNLRVLRVHHMGEFEYDHSGAERHVHPLNVLAQNPCVRNLERLDIHPRNSEIFDPQTGAHLSYLPLSQVRHLFDREKFPHLKRLHLKMSDLGDEGCKLLVESGMLQQLKVLDLSFGRITEEGAQMLVECPDTKSLELLNLTGNAIEEFDFSSLREAGVRVRDHDQLIRFGVGGSMYLFFGNDAGSEE